MKKFVKILLGVAAICLAAAFLIINFSSDDKQPEAPEQDEPKPKAKKKQSIRVPDNVEDAEIIETTETPEEDA